jgi:drug/metabolite transporter (DMT)-like permease
MSSRRADLLMLLVTLIWGGSFPLIKDSLTYTNANWFVAMRFLLAALVMLPFVIVRFKQLNGFLLLAGAVLGLLNGFGYYAQTIGLKTIGSAESAFITSITVILIPLLLPFFKLGKPHWLELIAVLICLFGVYILTGANFHAINTADLWTFVCALTTALSVLYLQKISHKITDYVLFAFLQIVFAAVIPLCSSIIHHQYHAHWSFQLGAGLLYCGIFSTALTFFLQTRYQQYTNPTKVGLIFTMEPVFAALFAFSFNREALTSSILLGGGIIMLSLVLSESKALLRNLH